MSNIFDIKRFWNFFLYDLRRAKNNYAISMLLIGLLPIIVFVVTEFFSLITGNGIVEIPTSIKLTAMGVGLVVILLGFGSKVYGLVTEKRAGSDYLMIPASTLEKWLSLLLVTCVVAPIVLGILYFISDGIAGLLFPNSYGARAFASMQEANVFGALAEEGIDFNFPAVMILNWVLNILTFTLGAICFKKAKVAKTLLCIFAVSMVLSTLLAIFAGTGNIDPEWIANHFDSPQRAVNALNWYVNITCFGTLAILLGGIFYRLRTIQH